MSRIFIEGKSTSDYVDSFGHLYLVYVDDENLEWVLRAGPEYGAPFFGKLDVVGSNSEGMYLNVTDDRRVDANNQIITPEERGRLEITPPNDMSPATAWSIMKQYASAISQGNFSYNPILLGGYNSNSFVGSLLSLIGVDVNDFLPQFGQPDFDFLYLGRDTLINANSDIHGSPGNDSLYLGPGDDTIDAGAGNDVIYGGAGSDLFIAGPGNDYVNGDTLNLKDSVSWDTLSYQNAPSSVTINVGASSTQQLNEGVLVATQDGFGDVDLFTNMENVLLSQNDDKFVFSDAIFGTDIEHLRVGGGGHSAIGDTAIFGQSNHHLEVVSGQIVVQLHEYHPSAGLSPLEKLVNAPALWLEGFNLLVGSNTSDTIQFGDTLWFANGGGGNDQFFGFTSNQDSLGFGYHATSPDIMIGANGTHVSGEQIMVGGVGDDLFVAGQLAEVMVGQDANLVMMNGQMTLLPFTLNTNMDTLSYERSNAGVTVVLKDQADVSAELVGGYAEGDKAFGMSNVIGSAFSDTLAGNSGMNTIKGGAGNDYIYGMGGNDIIDAGSGINEIWTGSGNDLVIVNTATGPQATIVHDFELLSDHLSVDVHHVTGYSLQNSHTIDGVSGRFIDPGLATISFDDGSIITLNVLAAQGYQGQGIYDWSIFA